MDSAQQELDSLFKEAKQNIEFEFVLTLINYRGIGKEDVTNLYEWFESIEFYKRLYSEFSGKEKTRIGALLYSTFFENSDFYNIIGSLCLIKLGYKGSSYLYYKTKNRDKLLGIGQKIEFITELLNDCGKINIIKFFDENHFQEIRNTFFHSAYSLIDNYYILQDSGPIFVDGVGSIMLDVEEFLYPKIERIVSFFNAFKDLYLGSHNSYQEDKLVDGLFPGPIQATIIGSKEGLRGFKIKNAVSFFGKLHDSGIWYNEEYDMWEAWNITMNFQSIETVKILEQLERYESKDDIKRSDTEFINLIDKLVERKQQTEINRAVSLLVKFGTFRYQKMNEEANLYKKKSLPKFILPYFKRAVEINTIFDLGYVQNLIHELEKV
jgi:hypothetical protein